MDFVDREDEIGVLRRVLDSSISELAVVYGRRRIGKSELVKQSLKNKSDSVYFQATESTPEVQLKDFIQSVKQVYPGVSNIKQDWESILSFLAQNNAKVAIDEFPYLVEAQKSIPSIFQRFWDNQDSKMKLILIGSSISVMEEKVLSGNSPLHGRWTERIDLKPLSFENASKFFPGFSSEEKICAWSTFGGTPHYLQSIDSTKDFSDNVSRLLLDEQGNFRDEPEFLLRSELSQPHRYMAILKAIASGSSSSNEIAQGSGVDSSSINTYLSKLERLRLVEREVPVTEDPPRSRSGRYRIKEPLIKFWFRFVYGNEDRIGLVQDPYQEIVEPQLNDHVSSYFEDLCLQKLPYLLERDYTAVGRWWYKEHEIDIVALTKNGKIIGECKYTNAKIGMRLLTKLQHKEENLRVDGETEYVLFSKSGFKQNIIQHAKDRNDIHLFQMDQIVSS